MSTFHRRLPFGAELVEGGALFSLWAPTAREVKLCLEGRPPLEMTRDSNGVVTRTALGVGPGHRYRFLIDGELAVPDPASRHQPEGVHGPSVVVDPGDFVWQHGEWRGRPWHETVLYEMHIGTFTLTGTFASAIERLDDLVELGVSAIELMPVAETPGQCNWGYDCVQLFAPCSRYGHPHDLKRLVDEAHGRNLMVFLDVVYNHFGPEGNYLYRYARDMFAKDASTPWGDAIDVDGRNRAIVRRYFMENALYWLDEYRFDGLRLDAVHAIPQKGEPTFAEELADTVRHLVVDRHIHLVVENDDNRASLLEGPRYDAQWNDDFHHALHVLITDESHDYYQDYPDPLRQLGRSLAEGFAYQGETSAYRGGRARGQASTHLPPTAFVNFVQNHDQVGNRAVGDRLSSICPSPAYEAAFTVLLLAPSIPLLFMGEEWAASSPFLYFCDFDDGRLQQAVFEHRVARRRNVAHSADSSRLRWDEQLAEPHARVARRYRELLSLRTREITPRLPQARAGEYEIDGRHLSVSWDLGDATLGLELNAGDVAVDVTAGDRVLATTSNATRRLPRWGALWWLRDG